MVLCPVGISNVFRCAEVFLDQEGERRIEHGVVSAIDNAAPFSSGGQYLSLAY